MIIISLSQQSYKLHFITNRTDLIIMSRGTAWNMDPSFFFSLAHTTLFPPLGNSLNLQIFPL